jgi:excisionase family DNA binding protein
MPDSDQMKDEPAIMTVREVAKYLRLSEAKVYRLVNNGSLPVVRIGKTWRFRKDILDEWLAERSKQEMQTSSD